MKDKEFIHFINPRNLSIVFLLVFLFFLTVNFITGVNTVPLEGDSINYHIPIAKEILNGEFLEKKDLQNVGMWYPGSSEVITAAFILLKIPLNLFNVLSIFILFIVLYKFGNYYLKNNDLSLIYASGIASTYGVMRLFHTQNIDVWMAIYLLTAIYLLENIKDKWHYFLFLGFISGMIIGSKYTGPLFLLVLIIVYLRSLFKCLKLSNIVSFLIPFSVFGLIWYLRNLILTGSPFYPQSIPFFQGLKGWNSYLSIPMWKAFLETPILMINAYISELMIWPGIFLFTGFILLYLKTKNFKLSLDPKVIKLFYISTLFFIVYLFLPYDNKYLGMVLSVRYIFTIFSLLVLIIFILSKKYKITIILSLVLILNSFVLFISPYRPKISYILIPVLLLLLFVINKVLRSRVFNLR